MSNWRDHGPVTDEDLVAYLDGLLDGEEAGYLERELNRDRALDARLELMRRGERPFTEAYDLLLQDAPQKRLKQILKLAIDPPPPPVVEPEPPVEVAEPAPPHAHSEPWGGWRVLAAAVVFLAVFSGGLIASRFIKLPGELPQIASEPKAVGWRAMVAYYQTLFVKETLEDTGNPQSRSANLRAALSHVGLDLSVEKVSVSPLEFKRAAVLNFNGKPLVQVAYLFKGETPVSFCIIPGRKPVHGVMAERREGLNIAHWRNSEYGFMVIGDVPADALDDIAKQLKQRLS